jgi:hypothetical protein
MSQGRTVTARTRLPVAANESKPPRKSPLREFAGWIVAGFLLLGGGTYWLLDRSTRLQPSEDASLASSPTLVLQQPESASRTLRSNEKVSHPRPQLPSPPLKQDGGEAKQLSAGRQPALTKVAKTADAKACACSRSAIAAKDKAASKTATRKAAAQELASIAARPSPIWPKPGRHSEQVHGRVVHVGAFSDVHQAKVVWGSLVHSYPAVGQFQPSLIENRDWNGKPFYQFQVETASEADSQMLCQSIERFNFRCAVMGVHSTH